MRTRPHPSSMAAFCAAALVAAVGLVHRAAAQELALRAASFLGAEGDSVRGARILSDGTIVLAANLAGPKVVGVTTLRLASQPAARGSILRLSADGRKVLSVACIAPEVRDLAVDQKDQLYVAAGPGGVMKLSPAADKVIWSKDLGAGCGRVDAAPDGHCVAVATGKGVTLFDPEGKVLAANIGRSNALDACIDGASRTVVCVGFRNARAQEGKRTEPVQICYALGVGYDGKPKWCNYDWATDRASDRFINKSANNMADTRAYRCAIGRDGRLYCAFESAGGNHIFRYSPLNIMEPVKLVGGDQYHQFHNSGAEHKAVLVKFDPATGKLAQGQQFCPRTERGRAGNARSKEGDLCADEDGRLFFAGYADPNLPVSLDPVPSEPRAGAFLLGLSADFARRLVCTRMQGRPEQGATSSHCVDARKIGGKLRVVYAGSGAKAGMHTVSPVQAQATGSAGFFVVLEEK